MKEVRPRYDVIILGAGLAGLSLCRQLLLKNRGKTVLLIDNKIEVPGPKQKVGESLVQVGGYYFSKVLDLEEHLLREHYPKYNLRFHWKTAGRENRNMEDYSRSYIRKLSTIWTYQLNRNKLEEHLMELNCSSPDVTFRSPVTGLQVSLSEEEGLHRIRFKHQGRPVETEAEWVVDATGRGQFLKKKYGLVQPSPIQNGSSWFWVEGLLNIEKLTDRSLDEIRLDPDRRIAGMAPFWLATNHFCGEGFWFWVIPLQGITSLGIVYDRRLFPADEVTTPEKVVEWVCREFPLFQRDLPSRKIVDRGRLADYAYDCRRTLSPRKWAVSGMAGRFSDPLYSPGSDLIALYNTLIVDTILSSSPQELEERCTRYEPLMRVFYEAYVPSYSVTYNVLGDQELFTLKYSWELTIYFSFYVFPFINDLFTEARFLPVFFRKFAQLGPINRNLQKFLSDCYAYFKQTGRRRDRVQNDFSELMPLERSKKTFFDVGLGAEEAEDVLHRHLESLKEFARYIYAYLSSVLADDPKLLVNAPFVRAIKLRSFAFDPEAIRRLYEAHRHSEERYEWPFDPFVLEKFRAAAQSGAPDQPSGPEPRHQTVTT